jgi:hypothetical protein
MFLANMRNFTKDTALLEKDGGAARQGRGTEWVRHGVCELALKQFTTS